MSVEFEVGMVCRKLTVNGALGISLGNVWTLVNRKGGKEKGTKRV